MMARLLHIISALCMLAVFAPPSHAQDDKTIVSTESDLLQCTSFSDALSAAYHSDPRIDSARGELERAKANLLAAKSQSMPQVTGFLQTGVGDSRLLNNQSDNLAAIQVQQTIFTFGSIYYAKKAAKAETKAANYNINRVASEVALDIGSSYLELLRSESLLALAYEKEEFYAQDAASVDKRLKDQVMTITEASQIKANYSVAISDRINASLTRDQALSRLETLIGYPLDCISNPAADFYFQDTEQYYAEKDLETLLFDAQKMSPAVRRSAARVESAQALEKQVNRNHLPSISVSGFTAREYVPETQSFFGTTPSTYADRNRIGISINQNFYQGGRGRAERMDAAGRVRIAENDLSSTERQIEDIVRRAWLRVQAQNEARNALLEARANLKLQLVELQKGYNYGVNTLDQVIRAADSYFRASEQEADTQYQYYNNLFTLRANTLGVVEYRVTP